MFHLYYTVPPLIFHLYYTVPPLMFQALSLIELSDRVQAFAPYLGHHM
jgi:hypothetical protein